MATKTRTIRPETVEYKTISVEPMFTQAQVSAILAEALKLSAISQPKPKSKAKSAPKPRPKAKHGEEVSAKDIASYKTLWKQRVALRKEIGTGNWAGDEASNDPKMTAIVRKMADLRAKGVNQFLVK